MTHFSSVSPVDRADALPCLKNPARQSVNDCQSMRLGERESVRDDGFFNSLLRLRDISVAASAFAAPRPAGV